MVARLIAIRRDAGGREWTGGALWASSAACACHDRGQHKAPTPSPLHPLSLRITLKVQN